MWGVAVPWRLGGWHDLRLRRRRVVEDTELADGGPHGAPAAAVRPHSGLATGPFCWWSMPSWPWRSAPGAHVRLSLGQPRWTRGCIAGAVLWPGMFLSHSHEGRGRGDRSAVSLDLGICAAPARFSARGRDCE